MDFIKNELFENLFPKNAAVIDAIREHMEENGFDPAFPIILATGDWTQDPVLIDGHTRLQVADELCISYIPTISKHFDSEDDALDYAIHNQSARRSLTDAEIARCLVVLDSRKQRGATDGFRGNRFTGSLVKAQDCAITNDTPTMFASSGKSAFKTAETLGISPRKVEQARSVMSDNTPKEIKDAVISGNKSINKAYEEVREFR